MAYDCFVQKGGSWSPRLVTTNAKIVTCGEMLGRLKNIAFSFRPPSCSKFVKFDRRLRRRWIDPRGPQWPSRGSALVQSSPCSSQPLAVGLGWLVARQFIPRKFGALLPAHTPALCRRSWHGIPCRVSPIFSLAEALVEALVDALVA